MTDRDSGGGWWHNTQPHPRAHTSAHTPVQVQASETLAGAAGQSGSRGLEYLSFRHCNRAVARHFRYGLFASFFFHRLLKPDRHSHTHGKGEGERFGDEDSVAAHTALPRGVNRLLMLALQ